MKKWEYAGFHVKDGDELAFMQEQGTEGWELVSMLPIAMQQTRIASANGQPQVAMGYKLVFKRELVEATAAHGENSSH